MLPRFASPVPCSVLLLGLCGAPRAQVLEVPGDYDDLQWALNMAPPGATVVVHGGTWVAVRVLKPVTIVGEPRATLSLDLDAPVYATAAVTLNGPGYGTVVLANVTLSGDPNPFLQGSAEPAILGGGFDELHLYDCGVWGASYWPPAGPLTGVAEGAPALDVDVDFLLLSRSTARGGNSVVDDCWYCNGPPGATAVIAEGATVVALDSTIAGGITADLCCAYGYCPIGGRGGHGLVAAELYEAGSTLQGGEGADYYYAPAYPPEEYEYCGTAPDGEPWIVSGRTELSGDLRQTGPLALGETWTLEWTTSFSSVLGIYEELRLEPFLLRSGPVFLDLVGPHLFVGFPAGASSYSVLVPDDPALLGVRLTAQVNELGPVGRHVTRPITSVIRP